MSDQKLHEDESTGYGISSAGQFYEIKVEGHLDHYWSDGFNGWEIRYDEDFTTSFIGTIVDQAELYGHLDQLRDLNVPLISAKRVDGGMPKANAEK